MSGIQRPPKNGDGCSRRNGPFIKKHLEAIAADSVFSVSLSYIGPENAFVMRS
jgi:hypothetical protein